MRNVLKGYPAVDTVTVSLEHPVRQGRYHVPAGGEWSETSATIPVGIMSEEDVMAAIQRLKALCGELRTALKEARITTDGATKTAVITVDGQEYKAYATYYPKSQWGNWGFFGPVPFLPESAQVRIFLCSAE